MGEFIVELSGTRAGEALALSLALLSALAHAIFGAVNKSGQDPYLNRGAINLCYGLMAAPFALFVFEWPSAPVLWILAGSYFVHIAYEWLQAVAYSKGAFTVVYPIARGTGPMVTAFAALVIFDETLLASQWAGLAVLSGSIIALAWVNYRLEVTAGREMDGTTAAVGAALLTGVMVAAYTTVDAYGIRRAVDPFAFIAWVFMLGGLGFPVIAYARWRSLQVRPPIGELAARGFFGALIAFFSFGAFMLATRLGKVGEAAALRETSIIFATGIGVLIFKERVTLAAIVLIGLIATGAVFVELTW